MRVRAIGWALLGALTGCGGQLIDSFDACELTAHLAPGIAAPGEVVTLLGGPLTAPYDSLVLVDGVSAEVLEVDRSDGCLDCDTCRSETLSCGGCPVECEDCIETLTFVTPELEPGETSLVLTNAYGTTGAVPFTVAAPATGTDTGA
jgi:hypothetical protein